MTEAKMCEACGGSDLLRPIRMADDIGEAIVCLSCRTKIPAVRADAQIRANRLRSRAPRELEPLDFVAQDSCIVRCKDSRTNLVDFSASGRVRFGLSLGERPHWMLSRNAGIDMYGFYVHIDDVPRIHAELCALRDSVPTPKADEAGAVEAVAIGHAAPGTCQSCNAFSRVRISANCTYCASRLHGQVRHVEDGDGIVAVAPAEPPPEPPRGPHDWSVSSTPSWEEP